MSETDFQFIKLSGCKADDGFEAVASIETGQSVRRVAGLAYNWHCHGEWAVRRPHLGLTQAPNLLPQDRAGDSRPSSASAVGAPAGPECKAEIFSYEVLVPKSWLSGSAQ